MAQLPSELISHSTKVCRLYKKALRSVRDWYPNRLHGRYESILLRKRFDDNRDIKDARIAKKLLLEGEEEVFQRAHWQPIKFATSIGGTAYSREVDTPDFALDYWNPMEKARYPKYFARREELKKEYEQLYYKLYPETPKTSGNKENA